MAAPDSEDHASHRGAGVKKYIVARVRKEFQRRMRDRLGESLGVGGWRDDLVGTSGDDRYRDRDFAKALRCEDRTQPRRHGGDGADGAIAIGVGGLAAA